MPPRMPASATTCCHARCGTPRNGKHAVHDRGARDDHEHERTDQRERVLRDAADLDARADHQEHDRVGEERRDAPERVNVFDDRLVAAPVLEPAVRDAAAERGEDTGDVQRIRTQIRTVRDEDAADHVQIAIDGTDARRRTR